MKRLRPNKILFFGLILLFASFLINAVATAATEITLERVTNGYRLTYVLPPVHFQTRSQSGKKIPSFRGGHYLPQPGKPILPVKAFSLILPGDQSPVIRVQKSYTEALTDVAISAFPDSLKGAANSKFPNRLVSFIKGINLFGVPVYLFRIRPFQYDSLTHTLKIVRKIIAEIQVPDADLRVISLPRRLSLWQKNLLKAEVLNFDQVRFHIQQTPLKRALGTWYNPAYHYVKFYVSHQGIYKVTHHDLIDSLGLPSDLDPRKFKIFYRGKQIPIEVIAQDSTRFQSGDYLRFYGDWNRGKTKYYDVYTDTSVYWFTYDGEKGKRMKLKEPVSRGGVEAAYFYKRTHFEEDHIYYFGDNDLSIFSSDLSPGECWIWERIYAGDSFSYKIKVAQLLEGDRPDSIRIRLRGITADVQNPDHHIRIYLNDSQIGDLSFDGIQEVLFNAAIPAGLLKSGSNTVRIQSVGDTGASRDAIYLDWIELAYNRSYVASDNYLLAQSPAAVVDTTVIYRVTLLHNPDILVYDLTDSLRIKPTKIEKYASDRYYVQFEDFVENPKFYWITTESAIKRPDRMVIDVPSHLRDENQGADYVILTAAPFLVQANRLSAYRQKHNGFRTAVIDVQDIFDEFSYGIFYPPAIRDFLKYAHDHWLAPSPSYVLFFGDGTWDYKHHLENSINRNFVPPIANPVSDNRYVAFNEQEPYVPQMFAGRLPVKSRAEAQTVVDKIIQYEQGHPAAWKKRVTFLNGGVNDWEQTLFKTESESLIRDFVIPAPFGGEVTRIYKTSQGRLVGELRPEIMAAIDSGCLWFNFMGHAGSDTWDLMIQNEDIPELKNSGKLPFITSMTCHTARFANPFMDSFAEAFVTAPDRGAIAFWGTTGWGYIYQDNLLLTTLFQYVLQDTLLDLGPATTLARVHLWQELGDAPTNRSALDQYTLIGDPALHLSVPKKPDLVLLPEAISFSPEEITQKDSLLNVNVHVYNYGLFVEDTVEASLKILNEEENPVSQKMLEMPPFGYSDSLWTTLSLNGKAGRFTLQAEVNGNGKVQEVNLLNNRASRGFSVYSTEITVSLPPNFAILDAPEPKLQVNVPEELPSNQAVTYTFELDTTRNFNSPLKMVAKNQPGNRLAASWQIPIRLQEGVYFWRCRMNSGEEASNWVHAVFQIQKDFGNFGWGQSFRTGFEESDISRLMPMGLGFQLAPDSARSTYLEVKSAGHDDGNLAYLIVNFQIVNDHKRGINVMALNGQTGNPVAPARVYDTYASETASDSLANFINSLPLGSVVLAGIMDDGSFHLTEKAYQALESIGSRYCRQIGFRDSWAIIGRKGASVGSVPEKLVPVGGGYAVVRDTLLSYRVPQGTITSEPIGPASAWHTAHFTGSWGENGTAIRVKILGRKAAAAAWDTLLSVPLVDSTLSLSAISAKRYPVLKMTAVLKSADDVHSPKLSAWSVVYDRVPDLTTRPAFWTVQPDSALEGTLITLTGKIFNIGMVASDSSKMSVGLIKGNAAIDTVATLGVPPIQPDESSSLSTEFSTRGFEGDTKVVIMIDSGQEINELSEANNSYRLEMFVQKDTLKPRISVTFDGREILPGDWVSTHPKISVFVEDNSPLAITDTSSVRFFLDSKPQYYANAAGLLEFEPMEKNGKSGAKIRFEPALMGGRHTLDVVAKDATLNASSVHLEFVVKSTFAIENLLNYPNPATGPADFTYFLTQPADHVTISLYTLSGRKIFRSENLPCLVGGNIFHWDGRDADGDGLANGVYLYKIQAERGEKSVSAIGKLIIIR